MNSVFQPTVIKFCKVVDVVVCPQCQQLRPVCRLSDAHDPACAVSFCQSDGGNAVLDDQALRERNTQPPRRFQLLLSLFRRRLKIRPLLPGLFQRLFPLFLLFGCQNPGRQSIQLPSQKFLLLLPFFQPYSGLIPEFLNRLKVLLVPKPAPVRSFRKPCRIWKFSSQTTRGIPAPGIPW